jgi:hypothetical protein
VPNAEFYSRKTIINIANCITPILRKQNIAKCVINKSMGIEHIAPVSADGQIIFMLFPSPGVPNADLLFISIFVNIAMSAGEKPIWRKEVFREGLMQIKPKLLMH